MQRVPAGVVIFGILLIVTSLFQLQQFLDFKYYRWILFYPLPEKIILIRYFTSFMLRILGFICGIGLLCRKELFRRMTLILAFLILTTIYWKHPFFVLERMSQIVAGKITAVTPLTSGSIIKSTAIITVIALYIIDITFSVCLIYYLTRPKVKAYFQ